MFWTSGFLIRSTIELCRSICSLEYELDGKWSEAKIISREQQSGNDEFHVYSSILMEIPSEANGIITGFRAKDSNGLVIGSKPENIIKSAGNPFIYRFKIRIHEEGN